MRWNQFCLRVLLVLGLMSGACGLQGATPFSWPHEGPTPTPTDIPTALKAVLDPLRLPPTAPTVPRPWQPVEDVWPTPLNPSDDAQGRGRAEGDLLIHNPALAHSLQQFVDAVSTGPYTPGLTLYLNIPGQGEWIGAGGYADRFALVAMQPHDRFRIGSLTKMFVATIVLQLVEENVLSLDDPVEHWLPGLVPNGQAIRIRHLLNHTSGLYDYLDGAFEGRYFASNPPRIWRPIELVRYGVAHKPYFAPGEPGKWKYSNTNYIVLGMIIERVTGTPLAYQLRSRLFEPLHMTSTFLEDYEVIPGGFVHGYILDKDYSFASLSTWAAGGIVSTARDIGLFARALFGGQLLSQAMLSDMLTFADMSGYPIYGLGVARNVEAFAVATQGGIPGPTRYPQIWGHTGGLSGFKSVVGYLPSSGITVVVLINQMWAPVLPIALDALDLATGQTAAFERQP